MTIDQEESSRIHCVYENRGMPSPRLPSRYGLYYEQTRMRVIVDLLRVVGVLRLDDLQIVDIGCAGGQILRTLVTFGATPDKCHGVDLMEGRVALAQSMNAGIHFHVCDAQELPFADQTCDICIMLGVLSSVLDANTRQAIASEALRILRPGGVLIHHDFIWNPLNKDTHGMRLRDIRQLFRGCRVVHRRSILAVPLARRTTRVSFLLTMLLDAVPLFRCFYTCAIVKQEKC